MCALNQIIFIIFFLFEDACCFFKPFKFHTDIRSPDLWLGQAKSKDCNGIIFTSDFHSVYIKELRAAQVILPLQGSMYITGDGSLEINPDRSNTCIKIGQIPLHSYYDPASWAVANPAVPSIERIPCRHDEVMFPYGLNSPVLFDDKIDLVMRHVSMDVTVVREAYAFRHFLRSGQWAVTAYAQPEVRFTGTDCGEESGCVCHDWAEQGKVCAYVRAASRAVGGGCVDAIEPPVGECSVDAFCGGVIHMKPKSGFDLYKLNRLLEANFNDNKEVAVYASKVAPDEHARLIQVVFAEDNYTGSSAEAAVEFFERLSSREMMEDLNFYDIKVYASGSPIVKGAAGAAAAAIVFGTLFAVFIVFASIYAYYVGPLKDYKLSTSFTSSSLPGTIAGVRYKSREEEQLIYEGQSMAGSVLSLDRAFDNPMYSHASASTSTGETVVHEQKEKENPLFEMLEKQDDLDKIEDLDSEI